MATATLEVTYKIQGDPDYYFEAAKNPDAPNMSIQLSYFENGRFANHLCFSIEEARLVHEALGKLLKEYE